MASLAHQIYEEFIQIRESLSLANHFKNVWNINDAIWKPLCPVIVLISMPSHTWIDIENLATISAFATFSMLVKVLDWMRLFD